MSVGNLSLIISSKLYGTNEPKQLLSHTLGTRIESIRQIAAPNLVLTLVPNSNGQF